MVKLSMKTKTGVTTAFNTKLSEEEFAFYHTTEVTKTDDKIRLRGY